MPAASDSQLGTDTCQPWRGSARNCRTRASAQLAGVITATLKEAELSVSDIDGVAATAGPGLIGGVIVGTMTAKAMASALSVPYYAVNHLEGHALTARLTNGISYPFLLLLVSGGHTQLLIVRGLAIMNGWAPPWMMRQVKPLTRAQP